MRIHKNSFDRLYLKITYIYREHFFPPQSGGVIKNITELGLKEKCSLSIFSYYLHITCNWLQKRLENV